MQLAKRNFGISGQDHEYDAFLCISKKCKKRKKERHKARMERKGSKTDQRKAETEQMRAETLVMKSMATPKAAPAVSNAVPAPTIIGQTPQGKPQVAQAGFGSNKLIVVVGLLLVGGFIYNRMKNKQAGTGVRMAPAPGPAIA